MGPRRYDLDWLRVLAFAGLILFHVGLLYVTWDYNLKSPRIVPDLEWALEALSPWRMALLFVISGVACRFLIERLGPRRFALERLARLGVVLVTGMLVINPAQVWVQLRAQGDTTLPYLDYWLRHYLLADAQFFEALGRPTPTWDHLWFLLYLLAYNLLFAATIGPFRRVTSRPWSDRVFIAAPALWMAATSLLIAWVAPFTHAFFDDWSAHLKWAGLFLTGAAMAARPQLWNRLAERRWVLAFAAVAAGCVYLACRFLLLQDSGAPVWTAAYRVFEGIYGWLAVLAIFGLARRSLDHASAALSYLTDAVLPVYVLHQPVLLTAAWLLFPLRIPLPVEAGLLVLATGGGSLAAYHLLIRPWRPVRIAFGLRPRRRASAGQGKGRPGLPGRPSKALG
jgi:surface polysaccharide O-acyltransferase-like enzyme